MDLYSDLVGKKFSFEYKILLINHLTGTIRLYGDHIFTHPIDTMKTTMEP